MLDWQKMPDDRCTALLEFFHADPRVRLAYAFGSQVHGDAGPLSDVDVAVLLSEPLDFDAERQLRADLLAIEPAIDLVILNDATVVLRHEVVTGGRCLLWRDEAERAAFEMDTLSRYLDFQPFRRVQQQYLQQRVEQRRGTSPRSHP